MAEYIEREAVLKEVEELKKSPWYNDDFGFGTKQARHDGVACVVDLCIKQVPVADVVEAVRCKDCIYNFKSDVDGYYVCSAMTNPNYVPLNHFCGYGERKETTNEI